MVINDGKVAAHHFISQSSLKKLTDYFENSNTAYYLQTQNFLVSKKWCVDRTLSLFNKLGYTKEDLLTLFGETVIDDNAGSRSDIEKLIYYDSGVDFSELQKNIGDEFYIVGYTSAISAIQAGRLRRAESTKPAELKNISIAAAET